MEGARISWDELTCIGYEVKDEEIEKLCADIMKYREQAGMSKRNVTVSQLVNWKLLKKTEASEKHRGNIGEALKRHRKKSGEELNDTQTKILELLMMDARLSSAKLADQIGIASRNVESNIKRLKERGF